jgi:hypothetical protein
MESVVINLILSISLNTTILIVWFLTDAFYEYFKCLSKTFFLKYQEYIKTLGMPAHYVDYLQYSNRNFITKLLSCPFCFGFWTSIFCSVILIEIKFVFVVYTASIILFFYIKNLCCKN